MSDVLSDHGRYIPTRRDRIAVPIINLVSRLASRRYRTFIQGAIHYGMAASVRDEREGRPAPKHWTQEARDE